MEYHEIKLEENEGGTAMDIISKRFEVRKDTSRPLAVYQAKIDGQFKDIINYGFVEDNKVMFYTK